MAIPANLQTLTENIETMLPLYKQKSLQALEKFVGNIEWNLKQLKSGAMDLVTWKNYTLSDFSNIALLLPNGEAGRRFADEFDERLAKAAPGTDAPVNSTPQAKATTESPSVAGNNSSEPNSLFDVRGFLKTKAAKSDEQLQWHRSVVDLCKLMGLDSSLTGRRALAKTIGLTPDQIETVGSEEGNELLRTHLVSHLAQNSGKLPVAIA